MFNFKPLGIKDAWIYESELFADHRGSFAEWFRVDHLSDSLHREFNVVQANTAYSKKGVIRGIHFSVSKNGQAKWVRCLNGSIWDVVVDLRPDSPTFKKWDAVTLSADSGKSIFISEGLGHGYLAMTDQTVVSYLLNSKYSPKEELTINPFDEDLAIKWPYDQFFLSDRDLRAPSLKSLLDVIYLK